MIIAILLALGLAFQTVPPEAAQHLQSGLAALKNGNMPHAIEEFQETTRLAPGLAAGFANLGAAYMQTHAYGDAISPLKRALQIDPSLTGAQRMLGFALLKQGSPAEALPWLEKSHLRDALGIAQVQLGRYPEAIANLNASLAEHPNDPELLYYYGRAAGLLSRHAFDVLMQSFPSSARAHQALAENYSVLRRVPEAEHEYQEAIKASPTDTDLHMGLGQLYAAAREWPKAETEFSAEAALQPASAEAAYRLGDALLQEGKIADARTQLKRADQLRPHMPETLYDLGKAASLDGDSNTAETCWKDLLSIEPNSPLAAQAHFGLAAIYRKQGKNESAERELNAYKALQAAGSQQDR